MFNSGIRGRRARDGEGTINSSGQFVQQQFTVPYVSRFAITDGSYVDTDDTAADPAGGQTVVLYGNGFRSGATVMVGSTQIGVVTVLDSTRITFTSPVLSSGSYTVYVTNSNGGTGILVPGIVYSAMPAFTTAAGSIGSYYETTAISNTIVATEGADPITYTLVSGSLPSGATLFANGVITGTAPVESNSTTYTFTIRATDSELQDSTRQFSLTINTDVVTWSSPTAGAEIAVVNDTTISNVSLSASSAAGYAITYSANALPTGISLSGNTISGTPTGYSVNSTVPTLLTANAATTNRSATRTISWTISVTDQFFYQTTLLLQAEQASSYYDTDASTNSFLITTNGDTRPSRFSPYWPGGWSAYFDGDGDYLTVPANSAFSFGTGDFTVEFWVYTPPFSNTNGKMIVDSRPDSTNGSYWNFGHNGSGVMGFTTMTTGGVTLFASASYFNQWIHYAVTRNGTNLKLFVNGQLAASATNSDNISSSGLLIGRNAFSGGVPETQYLGYISNIRIIKGTALYTANFTPSTTSLTTVANTSLLTLRDSTLTDASSYNFAITRNGDTKLTTFSPFNTTPYTFTANSYSVYFDGTGDYLTATISSSLQLGTGDFTIECWSYLLSRLNTQPVIFSNYNNYTTGGLALFAGHSGGTTTAYQVAYNGAAFPSIQGGTIVYNNWVHLAVVRYNGTLSLYVNGISVGTPLTNATASLTGVGSLFYIGTSGDNLAAGYIQGYLSNFRVVKGTALYTANFTPSTTALTSVANTSILTCQSTTIKDNSTNNFTITVYGDARPSRVNPFGETVTAISNYTWSANSYSSSGYFDGTGDSLTLAANSAFSFGTGDFTAECWFYLTSASGNYQSILFFTHGGGSFIIRFGNSGSYNSLLQVAIIASAASNVYSTSWSQSALFGQWVHIAFTRQSSTCKVFVNGIQQSLATGTTPTSFTLSTFSDSTDIANSSTVYIGSDSTPSAFNGYISNMRLTKGTAIYIGPFVQSSAPLATVANVSLLTLQSDIGSNSVQFIDQSPHNHLITRNGNASQGSYSPLNPTSWSAYFDGTGSVYITLPANTSFAFGTLPYTVEFWIYMEAYTSTYNRVFDLQNSGGFGIQISNSGVISITKSGSADVLLSSGSFTVRNWNHVAVTRTSTSSNSTQIFINGSRIALGTDSNDWTVSATPRINGSSAIGSSWQGYLSNFRIVKGTAIYSANFTPASTTLSSVANTSVLCLGGPTFNDDGPYIHAITRTGDVKITPFGPFAPHTITPKSYSVYFDGNGDYLSVPYNTALNLSSGDFTIEGWFYCTALTAGFQQILNKDGVFNASYPSYSIGIDSSSVLLVELGNGNGTNPTTTTYTGSSVTLNTWNHFALVKSGTTIKIYQNGLQTLSTSQGLSIIDGGKALLVGYHNGQPSNQYFNGYISNLRILKGTALYTANFTPSTTALTSVANTSLLTCQTSTITDNSSNAFAITVNGDARPKTLNPFGETVTPGIAYSPVTHGGSVYFDGSGDYLTIPHNPVLNLASGDFTIEGWFYCTGLNAGAQIICNKDGVSGVTYSSYSVEISSAGLLQLNLGNGAGVSPTTTTYNGNTIFLYSWTHFAVVKTGSTIKFFQNGLQVVSTSQGTSITDGGKSVYVGYFASGAATAYFKGYIFGIRILKGTALYTSSFVPPAAPTVPTTANTSLLLNFTSSGVVDSTGRNVLESVGNARAVTTVKKYGSGSYYFDGTGDYLVLNNLGSMYDINNGDFTVEAWLYPTSFGSTSAIISLANVIATGYAAIRFRLTSTGQLQLYISTDGSNWAASGTSTETISLNTWSHVALVRYGSSSNNVKTYINGTATSLTFTYTGTAYVGGAYSIGTVFSSSAASEYFTGYIDDLRITKGRARYTANFTAPAQLLNR